MGTALQNLDNLVQMPRGCGEQNMVLFAPIIYVLQYLKKARLLTEEIRSRAVGFLELGELVRYFFLDTFSRACERLIRYKEVPPKCQISLKVLKAMFSEVVPVI